eukprot:15930968-Heterocapsa_arctica.AAC.1
MGPSVPAGGRSGAAWAHSAPPCRRAPVRRPHPLEAAPAPRQPASRVDPLEARDFAEAASALSPGD